MVKKISEIHVRQRGPSYGPPPPAHPRRPAAGGQDPVRRARCRRREHRRDRGRRRRRQGSFYNHFADRDALARALAEQARAAAEALAARTAAGVGDPAERVARRPLRLRPARRWRIRSPRAWACALFHGALHPRRAAERRGSRRRRLRPGGGAVCRRETRRRAILLAVGVVQIAISRVLSQDLPQHAGELSQDLAFGLLRALGPGRGRGPARSRTRPPPTSSPAPPLAG